MKLKEKGYIPTSDFGSLVKSGRVSKRAGRYFVSVLLDTQEDTEPVTTDMTDGIGLRLGIRELALTSTGVSYENINKIEAVRKLKNGCAVSEKASHRNATK